MRVERSGRMAVTGDSLGGPGRRLLKDQRVIGYGGRDFQRCFVVVCILCSFNRLLWVCPFFLSHYYLASRFRRSRIRAHRLWLMRCRWKSMRRWRRALHPNSRFQVAVLGYIYWYRLLGRWARVIMSSRRSVILLFCHSAVLSICCFVNLSVCKLELRHSVWYLVCPLWHLFPSLWHTILLYYGTLSLSTVHGGVGAILLRRGQPASWIRASPLCRGRAAPWIPGVWASSPRQEPAVLGRWSSSGGCLGYGWVECGNCRFIWFILVHFTLWGTFIK